MQMQMAGKFPLEAPIEDVWAFLLDIETLTTCIPGVEEIRAIDDKSYAGIIKQKVGPISVRVEFVITLKEIDPPRFLKVVGRGSDKGFVGSFSLEMILDLAEISREAVEIAYDLKVNIAGVPVFGKMIMESKAKGFEKEFSKNLREKLMSQRAGSNC